MGIMDSVTHLPSLRGKIKSGGMVNAYQAIQLALKDRSLKRR
jgi:hypothetical protein